MRIGASDLGRRELLRRVGNLQQAGGVRLLRNEEGHARGVRELEFRTGSGFRFSVVPDRGLDPGLAEYGGTSIPYLQPTLFPAPQFYEGDRDPYAWLRVGLGGLCNTAGLVSIGTPREIDTSSFGFTQRLSAPYGTHDRIAVTPAERFAHGERWEGDRCVLWAEGTVRQSLAYGENLSLSRRYESELGASSFRLTDVVANDGWFETPHQLLYHWNVGWPLVDEGAEVLAPAGEPRDLSFSPAGEPLPASRWRTVTEPVPGFTHEGFVVPMRPAADGTVAVAVVNRRLRPELGGLGVYLRYDAAALPVYVAWRMMREGLYAIGLEPSTHDFGEEPLRLRPGERRTYRLEFGVLAGGDAIDAFAASST